MADGGGGSGGDGLLRNSSGRVSMRPLIVSAGPTITKWSSSCSAAAATVGGGTAGAFTGSNGGLAAAAATATVLCLGMGGASACGTSKSHVVTFSELRAAGADRIDGEKGEGEDEAEAEEVVVVGGGALFATTLARLCMLEAIDRLLLVCGFS